MVYNERMDFQGNRLNGLYALAFTSLLIVLAFWLGIYPFDGDDAEDADERFSSCAVFAEEHCNTGNTFDYLGIQAVGFDLPEGTEIYAPIDGVFTASGPSRDFTTGGRITTNPAAEGREGILFAFVGEYELLAESKAEIREGDLIGRVIGGTVVEDINNSTIVVYFQRISPEGFAYDDPVLLRRYFGSE
jgi:hypothetical protein